MKYVLILSLLVFSLNTTFAQSNRTSDSPEDGTAAADPAYDWSWKTGGIPTTPPPPPTPVPIDGGMGFLLAAGCAYGLRNLRRKK